MHWTRCPRRLWMPHPWRHSRPGWMWLWAAWSAGWRPCTQQGVETRWSLWSFSTQAILWSYDSMIDYGLWVTSTCDCCHLNTRAELSTFLYMVCCNRKVSFLLLLQSPAMGKENMGNRVFKSYTHTSSHCIIITKIWWWAVLYLCFVWRLEVVLTI